MLPTTYQYLTHLDDLNAAMRDANFPLPTNKPLDTVNSNENNDNISRGRFIVTYCRQIHANRWQYPKTSQ